MLHIKFRRNLFTGSEEKVFEGFSYHIWARRPSFPSWSFDTIAAEENVCSPYTWRLHAIIGFNWPSCFRGEDH